MAKRKSKRAKHASGLFDEIVVDNFAGGGGASIGIERALGRAVDVAVNHDREAVLLHSVNHPHTRHYCEDVFRVDPREATGGRPVGLAWFSPDCFPAGTLVLTEHGYRPIEEIEVGDLVLTHKMRWRRVTETHATHKPLLCIRGHGHPGLEVSPEHPFYARRRTTTWNNTQRRYEHSLEPADWMPASTIEKGWYWATPCRFPAADAPPVPGRGITIDEKLMWLVGRYLGDGWTRLSETRAELVITCDKRESIELRATLSQWPRIGDRCQSDELEWHERHTGTAYQFTTNHRGLVVWLREHFGHRAEAKRLPAWALGLDLKLREALLSGYLSADGYETDSFIECRTVSKALAFSVKALANSLDKTVTVYKMANSSTIEGREVNARPIYFLRWRHVVCSRHEQTTVEALGDGHVQWCPIRETIDTGAFSRVFNIGVEEDESYVVEGVLVHNCKHFSRAKGAKPVSKKIRGLAWVVIRWAATVRPRVIFLENVREFCEWGPCIKVLDAEGRAVLGDDGRPVLMPCKRRKGATFRRWVNELRRLGYEVEWRHLNAADFGAPTHRRRLFLVARCDGQPIVWPEPTHGPGRAKPYRTAAECIDWSIPCHSIFLSKVEAKVIGVIRPLAEKTMRRIAMGLKRFVLENPKPFIVRCDHGGNEFRGQSIDTPLQTIAAKHGYGIVSPSIVGVGGRAGQSLPTGPEEPLGTITAKNDRALMLPLLTARFGEAPHQETRGQVVQEPLRTVTARTGGGFNLVTPFVTRICQNGGNGTYVNEATEPLTTVVSKAEHCLISPSIQKYFGGVVGQEVTEPLPTITATDHNALLAASLVHYNQEKGDETRGSEPTDPLPTITAQGNRFALTAAYITRQNFGEKPCDDVTEPLRTITAQGNHHTLTTAEVAFDGRERAEQVWAFLMKYFGHGTGQECDGPLHTVTTKDRFGLVTVSGMAYRIVDIGLRMLQPRELYRAQGFPDSYVIDPVIPWRKGKYQRLPANAQVRMCGNSVSPPVAEALVRANYAMLETYPTLEAMGA